MGDVPVGYRINRYFMVYSLAYSATEVRYATRQDVYRQPGIHLAYPFSSVKLAPSLWPVTNTVVVLIRRVRTLPLGS